MTPSAARARAALARAAPVAALALLGGLVGCANPQPRPATAGVDGATTDVMPLDAGVAPDERLSFVCGKTAELDPRGRVELATHRSLAGDWTVALPPSWSHRALDIQHPRPAEAAALLDPSPGAMALAGFVASTPDAAAPGALSSAVDDLLGRLLAALPGGATVVELTKGAAIRSHDDLDTVVDVGFALETHEPLALAALRATLLRSLLRRDHTSLPGLTAADDAPRYRALRVRLALQRRADGRLLAIGGVGAAPTATAGREAVMLALDDLANASALARADGRLEPVCETLALAARPTADILWVIDGSWSMSDQKKSVAHHAEGLFERALAAGIDFRMGVTGMVHPQDNAAALGRLCSPDGADRFLTADERLAFETCVAQPPLADAELEYGLLNAQRAVLRHLPRQDEAPDRVRPHASLEVIIISDERAQSLADLMVDNPALAPLVNCAIGGTLEHKLRELYAPDIALYTGATGEGGAATVHLIGAGCESGCADDIAHGYMQVARATGGLIEDVCQQDLGGSLHRILDTLIERTAPARLSHPPVSSSLAAAIRGRPLQRSRSNGFDYRLAANALLLIGVDFERGEQALVSYLRWVDEIRID